MPDPLQLRRKDQINGNLKDEVITMQYVKPQLLTTRNAALAILGMGQGKASTEQDSDSADNRPSNGAAYDGDE